MKPIGKWCARCLKIETNSTYEGMCQGFDCLETDNLMSLYTATDIRKAWEEFASLMAMYYKPGAAIPVDKIDIKSSSIQVGLSVAMREARRRAKEW